VARKKQPKIFTRKGGDTAFAYSAADEVRLTYNGWTEMKEPEPADQVEADATGDEGSTSTSAGATKKTAPAKKAAS
jgi:hypothetical protein